MAKGSQFERDMCREFSLWLSHGQRDDLLWRTSQSGGRATTRRQKGAALATKGCYGDVCVVDTEHPVARLWGQHVSMELKRGYSGVSVQDLVDLPDRAATRTFESFIKQARDDAKASGRKWLIVWKRDKREPVVVCEFDLPGVLVCKHGFKNMENGADKALVWEEYHPRNSIRMLPLREFFAEIQPPEEAT